METILAAYLGMRLLTGGLQLSPEPCSPWAPITISDSTQTPSNQLLYNLLFSFNSCSTSAIMLTGIEVAGLVLGVMGLVPMFKEAYKLVQARQQGSRGSDTARLAEEVRNGETCLATRYQEFYRVYGEAFAKGDGETDYHGAVASFRIIRENVEDI